MPGAPANMRFILQQRISWRMQTNQIVVANNGPVILPILKRETADFTMPLFWISLVAKALAGHLVVSVMQN